MNDLVKVLSQGEELPAERREPVWKGPERDGITYSLLCRFLNCRERFHLLVVKGLKPAEVFNHRIEYGQMWHVCEEALAGNERAALGGGGETGWENSLRDYARSLCRRYRTQQEQIDHWYNVCKVQFPLYIAWWAQHPDVLERKPLLQEEPFKVSYRLPSGRIVFLRGKWDSVDLIGRGKAAGIYIQENKSKGDIHEGQLRRQLTFDLQTMIYVVALREWGKSKDPVSGKPRLQSPVAGVRYNVIRRPLSGGKGSIVRHKATKSKPEESKADFYARLSGIIQDAVEPNGDHYYFMRWKTEISDADVDVFRRQCLDPILEQLCDWWEWVGGCMARGQNPFVYDSHHGFGACHWRHPFGVYNVLDEGGSSDLDAYLESGSEVGLERVENLFPELT